MLWRKATVLDSRLFRSNDSTTHDSWLFEDIFVKLTEEARRDRLRRLDGGDESVRVPRLERGEAVDEQDESCQKADMELL